MKGRWLNFFFVRLYFAAISRSTECRMVMNVLWTRLGETGKEWRLVYKVTLFVFLHSLVQKL